MTALGVSDVLLQDGTAWCRVLCTRGVLRVGNELTQVLQPDGSVAQVHLTVEAIELAGGPAMELETHQTARIRLTGPGVELVQPGCSLENTRQWQFATDSRPPLPDSTGSLAGGSSGRLGEFERPRLYAYEAPALRRWTTAFRLILVIPHFIVISFLGLAAVILVFLGWFGALFTGRLPKSIGEFLEYYFEYRARLYGYYFLLTDEYPTSFTLTKVSSPIRLELPDRGPLNRWAVLFRIVLMVPAVLVSSLVTMGWWVAAVVIWLIVLVRGRFPSSLFQATVGVLRFSLRCNAYVYLLTSRYPRGLFIDEPGDALAFSELQRAAWPPAAPELQPQAGPAVAPQPGPEAVPTAGPTATPSAVPTATPTAWTESSSRLVTSRGAKALIVVFLILGVFGTIGNARLNVALRNVSAHTSALVEVQNARQDLADDFTHFTQTGKACSGQSDQLVCVQAAEAELVDDITAFRHTINDIDHPSDTDDLFKQLSTTAALMASGFHQLANAPSAADYQAAVTRVDLKSRVQAFDQAYSALVDELTI